MTNNKSTRDDSYLMWTCGLMAIIIVALAVLWIQQRRRAQHAIRQLNQLSAERDGQTDEVAEMLRGRMLAHRPIRIDHDVTIDGRPVTALLVTAGTGRTLGLDPGDVLIVDQEIPPEPPDVLLLPSPPPPDAEPRPEPPGEAPPS